MKKRLLFLVLRACHSFPPKLSHLSQVKDIRRRGVFIAAEAATVFSYLPIKIGYTRNEDRVTAAVKACVCDRVFSRSEVEADGNVLVVEL